MPKSDMTDLSSEGEDGIENMILEAPMYYILSQFFETEDHKNVATLLQELVSEMREIKTALVFLASKKNSSSTCPCPPKQTTS